MRVRHLFTKTSKTAPADEVAKNAQLLIRAGYVYKVMAGVYAYTPLGLRVLEKIKQIVREEMNAIGGQELIMSNLQHRATWEKTGRWDEKVVDVWFKTHLQDGTEMGLAWTHEEAIIELMQQYIKSYKDLPTCVYQFQTKLRNELRSKSGIMRGREFVMKDMYSLHATEADCDAYYDKVIKAYERCYERCGIGEDTYITFASGGDFTKFSHEFQTVCDAGEDTLYVNADRSVAVNEEVLDDATSELGIDKALLQPVTTAEVGNIFKFGTEKSQKMGLSFTDTDGKQQAVYLASYGIGITRVMGVIVEKFADDRGLVWPESIAPYSVYLVALGEESKTVADELYDELWSKGVSVLYDDRDERAGAKFADADLLGIPHRVVVSQKLIEQGSYEYKGRQETEATVLTRDELFARVGAAEKRG